MKLYRAVSRKDYENYVKDGGIAPSTNLPGVESQRIYLGTRSYSENFLDIYLPSWGQGLLLEVDVDEEMLPVSWAGRRMIPDDAGNIYETYVTEFIPMSSIRIVEERDDKDVDHEDTNQTARF